MSEKQLKKGPAGPRITERKKEENVLVSLNKAAVNLQACTLPCDIFGVVCSELEKFGFRSVVFLFDGKKKLTLSYSSIRPNFVRFIEKVTGRKMIGFTFPLSKLAALKRAVTTGKPVFEEDGVAKGIRQAVPVKNIGKILPRLVKLFGPQNGVSTPLQVKGSVRGILSVFSPRLGEKDLPTIEAFAKQVSVALERAELMQEIMASEEKYRGFVENASDLIQSVGPDGRFIHVNKKWLKTLGYSRRELEKMRLQDIIRKDHMNYCVKMFNKVSKGQSVEKVRTVFVAKNGREIFVEGSAAPRFKGGRFVATWGIFRDITKQKIADDELYKSEQKYRGIFTNMLDGFAFHEIVLDKKGKPIDYVFLEVNDAFEKLTGLKRKNIIGKRVTKALPGIEKDPANWIGLYGKVALGGGEIKFEHFAKPLNKWYNVSVYSPKKGQFVTIFDDVTKRKNAEEEKSKLLRAIETTREAINITTPLGIIVYANAAMEALYGYRKGSMATKHVSLLNTGSLQKAKKLPKQIINGVKKNGIWEGEILAKRKDGTEFTVLANVAALKDKAGMTINYVSSQHDITHLKKYQDILAEKVGQLERTKREKDNFISMVTHELKTPLTPIKGYLDLLLREKFGTLNPKQREALEIVLKSTDLSSKLIDDLSNLSKLEAPEMHLTMQRVELDSVIDSAVKEMESFAIEKGVLLYSSIQSDLPKIIADRDNLARVFANLIHNAIKFTPSKGVIRINAKKQNAGILCSVSDNGIGITKTDVKKLFKKFPKISTRQGEFYKGTGLGLTICKTIVEKHGGKIWAESKKGKGTAFYFTLPAGK